MKKMTNYIFIVEFNMPREGSLIYEGSPCWMDKRMELFKNYTLPSLNSQTDQNFYAFLICDPDTPKKYKLKLKEFENKYKFIKIIWSKKSEGKEADEKIITLYKTLSPTENQILASICDNDDLIHIQYVETAKLIYYYLEQGITNFPLESPIIRNISQIKDSSINSVNLINFSHGLYWDIDTNKFLDSIFPTNAFFTTKSTINNFLNPRHTNHHDVVKLNNSLIFDTQLPMWVQIIHGENLWNRLDRMPGDLCHLELDSLKEHYGFEKKIKNKKMEIKINYKEIRNLDLSHLIPLITREDHKPIINGPAGRYHYKLLAYLSNQINNINILELGTHHGTSSTALSINKTNNIRTYDIDDSYGIKPPPKNVNRIIGNIFQMKQENLLLEADWIFLDTAHRGDFEWKVYCYLRDNNYKGFIIYDDIWWSNDMIKFWNKIPNNIKHDITDIGHGKGKGPLGDISGTGIVDFNNNVKIIK